MVAKMRNIGEACTAANRFYVHSAVADEFSRRLAKRMAGLRLGRGVDDGVEVGPLITVQAREKVTALVSDAVHRGAKVLVGAEEFDGPGHFYRPTVLTDVPRDARMQHEEIFGPVAPVTAFDTEEEAIADANDTEYGLVSYVYTRDLNRAVRVCERLETGMIGLNQGIVSNPAAPFGGVKHSGLGREGGRVGIEEFLEIKYVALNVG
jgi:succinate-semialdehyde dehydrogenase/glutarate-semialdehyde dehydrogenase